MARKGKRLDIKCKKVIVEFVEKAVAEAIEQGSSSCRTIGAAGCGTSAKHVGDASQRHCFRSGDRSDDGEGKTMARKGKRLDIKCKHMIEESVEKAVAEAIEQRASSCRTIDAASCGTSAKHVGDAKTK